MKSAPERSSKAVKSKASAKASKAAKPVKAAGGAKDGGKRKGAGPALSLDEIMRTLERAGSEKTRTMYRRHFVAGGDMFGVQFQVLKPLSMRIGFDQDLAVALWKTGNFDARNLAVKIADADRITPAELDRWARDFGMWVGSMYVAATAAESPHGAAKVEEWLASPDEAVRSTGWALVGQLASRHDTKPDAWFEARIADIERKIGAAPNNERSTMNRTMIEIGGRSAALRRSVVAAAKRIGKVVVDHGDTACKTPDAVQSLDLAWDRAAKQGFATPALHERSRKSPRIRC